MIYYSDDRAILMQGDCLELLARLPDRSINAVITDPPYGITGCKWDSVIPLEPLWAQLKRVLRPKGAIVLFGAQPFTSALIMSNLKMFKYCWVWEKPNGTNFAGIRYQPFRVSEDIAVFAPGSMTYNPQMTLGKPYKCKGGKGRRSAILRGGLKVEKHITHNTSGDRHPRNVVRFNSERGFHPTQKPVPLMEYLIKTYTNEGETILDFTMGSGTTGVAAMNTGWNFVGIEQDEKYCAIAKGRICK